MFACFADWSAGASPSNSRGARRMTSTFWAMRSSTSETCFAVCPCASVTTSFTPRFAASSRRLFVSAMRQGLSLSICENPTV